ncbi:MAG: hypothetical protein VX986_05085 [Pseudomonadota bacterium]|nr:hypothetical protein [Pseudomonadota bacterium]
MLGPEQINVAHRPTPIFLEGTTPVRVTEEIALQLGLKDGQTVRAVIENRGDLLRLILNQRDLNWAGSSRFKPGDKVDLKVSFGANGVTLTPVAASTGQNAGKPMINMLPTSLLSLVHRPNQTSILNSVLKPGGLDQVLGYVGAREWAQKLEQLKTSMGRLTPGVVKRGLASSGLFGESLLLSGRQLHKADLKQVLRGLLKAIPEGSQISKSLEQAVLEIEGRQVDSLSSQQNRDVALQFSLPFTDAEPVSVELYKEPDDQDPSKSNWIINLHTKSEQIGEVWLKTSLLSESNVDMTMWAVRGEVAENAKLIGSELEYELQNFGLSLDNLTVLNAARPIGDTGQGGAGNVVDVST